MIVQNHFWCGALCKIKSSGWLRGVAYPKMVNAVSDKITIIDDLGNRIPDKSWMLYLSELFIDKYKRIPAELNLICQFDGQDYFEAIIGGYNQYRFKSVLPKIGHCYTRQIILNPSNQSVIYGIEDNNTFEKEIFELNESNIKHFSPLILKQIEFIGTDHFTGIEWWNKIAYHPYPIRYSVSVSYLMYSTYKISSASDGIVEDNLFGYKPYTALKHDKDPLDKQYPIYFKNIKIIDNCISYNVNNGNSTKGPVFNV